MSRNKITISTSSLILAILLFSSLTIFNFAEARNTDPFDTVTYMINYCGEKMVYTSRGYSCTLGSYGSYKVENGYSCVYSTSGSGGSWTYERITCTKSIPASYSTQTLTSTSLRGVYTAASSNSVTAWNNSTWNDPSPYIYIHNAPVGELSITPDSDLDRFTPAQPFTLDNTWLLESTNKGEVSLAGEEVDHLFYRLAIDDITLSRNGRNFSSQAEIINYLESSDFLSKLGLSTEEAANSLQTIVGDIKDAKDSPYYYLTILDEASINNVSKLNITPAPAELIRSYFAVYPTPVPVKTIGDFVFPEARTVGSEYTIKETGELLIGTDTFVNFQ